jgi:hypothetical protein
MDPDPGRKKLPPQARKIKILKNHVFKSWTFSLEG